MKSTATIGPCPVDERPIRERYMMANVNDAYMECVHYIEALLRRCGRPPQGCSYEIEHLGEGQYTVVVEYDLASQEQLDFAFSVECEAPRTWAQVQMERPAIGVRSVIKRPDLYGALR
jgi:hypothetical protein